MTVPNRPDGVSMPEYWQVVPTQYGAWQEKGIWHVPAFPNTQEHLGLTPSLYMAFVMAQDAIKLQARNQG